MAPGFLACPVCGAAVSDDQDRCGACGARLVVDMCPECLGRIFTGMQRCPHCDAPLDAARPKSAAPRQRKRAAPVVIQAQPAQAAHACPRCGIAMRAALFAGRTVERCPNCEGMWMARAELEQMYEQQHQQALLERRTRPRRQRLDLGAQSKQAYVRCPVCGATMNRRNFARTSGVVVDICLRHGTWFDRDELAAVLDFIASGGLAEGWTRKSRLDGTGSPAGTGGTSSRNEAEREVILLASKWFKP